MPSSNGEGQVTLKLKQKHVKLQESRMSHRSEETHIMSQGSKLCQPSFIQNEASLALTPLMLSSNPKVPTRFERRGDAPPVTAVRHVTITRIN